MTVRPRATEIPELVKRLGSHRQVKVDAARARLSIIGARAVEALIESLDSPLRTVLEINPEKWITFDLDKQRAISGRRDGEGLLRSSV